MRTEDLKVVKVPDVQAPGAARPATVEGYTTEKDAFLAIRIVTLVLEKLQGAPYYLVVLSVCHSSEGGMKHDVLLAPHPSLSSLPRGVHSVEINCWEVQKVNPLTLNWRQRLELDAGVGWTAEVQADLKE